MILPGLSRRGKSHEVMVSADLLGLLDASSTVILAVMALREIRAMREELQRDRSAFLAMLQRLSDRVDALIGSTNG